MAKTNWNKTLGEVLKHETSKTTFISKKTGNEYTTDTIKKLVVASVGLVEEINGEYKYSIVDTKNDLEYSIKVSKKIDVKFGNILIFTNVRGGATSNGIGWYSADSVEVVQKNA